MKTGIQKVSVYDPATGTVVQINNVNPEANFEDALFEVEDGKGRILFGGRDPSFEFMSLDLAGFSQLETWMEDETPVRLVTLGVEQHILWYESSLMTVRKNYGAQVGDRNGFTVKIQSSGGTPNILMGTNLLKMYFDWVDDVAPSNQADNYDTVGSISADAFTAFVQTLTTIGVQTVAFQTDEYLIYPIANAKMQLSVRVDTLTNGTALVVLAEIENYASGFLADESALLSVGFKEFETPSNTYKMRLNILSGETDDNLDADLAYPFLGVQYGKHKDINY